MNEPTNPPLRPPSQSAPSQKPQPRPARAQTINAFLPTVGVGVLLAVLFTAWTPNSFFWGNFSRQLSLILTPQPQSLQGDVAPQQAQLRIGIVAGHYGNDSGAVCYDNNGNVTLTEAEVNLNTAKLVHQKLTAQGYQVDLLNEFDTRLNGFRGVALVSIHNDSCEYINEEATGFKVAAALNTRDVNRANRLTACLVDRYHTATQLNFHFNSITGDMREYHAFSEIDPTTIAAIIETGFLNLDQKYLTENTDQVAEGVVQGILCFMRNENVVPTPIP